MGFSVTTANVGQLDGDYISASVPLADPRTPEVLIETKFTDAMEKAEEMLELLVGADGQSGYLGNMNSVLESAPTPTITAPTVDTSYTLETSGQSLPVFDGSDLEEYPTDTYAAPSLTALPTIDVDFSDVEEPTDISPTMTWSEESDDLSVYTPLLARVLSFIEEGATGIDPDVEQALYERARTRQYADRVAEYNRINNVASEMQFMLPSGVLASGLADYSIGANRQDADIENQIIITQAELEQKNNQAMTQLAIGLEDLVRRTKGEKSNRALEFSKQQITAMIQDFAERVRKYTAILEGRKTKVMAQAEVLKGVIESNRGLIDIFREQYAALKTRVDAVTAKNKGIVDVYLGEVQGFGEAEKAVASRNDSAVKLIESKVAAAELELRAATEEARNLIAGYTAEGQLKSSFSTDMAKIAAQCFAALTSSVNASASLGYSGSDSRNSSFSVSASGNESHSVEHDPVM